MNLERYLLPARNAALKPTALLFAGLLLLSLVAAGASGDTGTLIGGHDQTSENFTPTGGWRTINMTPGWVAAPLSSDHVVISEVAPRGAGTGGSSDSSEYMEIANPTAQPVALDNYYVSDDINYYRIVNGPYSIPPIGDFNLRFPPGTVLNPGEVALIVKSELGFLSSFGGLAAWNSFCAANSPPGGCTSKIFAMDSRVHPPLVFTPMIDAAGTSLGTSGIGGGDIAGTTGVFTNPSSTNGEWVVLYQWDGFSDLVCDVDYASWGFGVGGNNPKMDKSGVVIDGPDGDLIASRYNNDTPAAGQSNLGGSTATPKPNTYQRVDGEVGEIATGGNGCTSPPANQPPILSGVPSSTAAVDELVPFTFQASAMDPDVPAQTLTFSLQGAPAGAAIDPVTGVFTWTPSEAQGPGLYTMTVLVTDSGSPPRSDARILSVNVQEVNLAPVLSDVPASATVDELTAYSFTASATDADLPAQTLTFSLVGAPPGAAIDPQSGGFTWTPTEEQGPGVFSFAVRVSDGVANTDQVVTLSVSEVNVAPVLTVPGPFTVNEGDVVSFAAGVTDVDVPANTLTFSLVAPSPPGAAIDPGSGAVSWTTTDNGSFTLRVEVSDGQGGSDTHDVAVTVLNVAPTAAITGPATGSIVPVGSAVTFTGTFVDPGSADTHTATWSFDGLTQAGAVSEATHSVSATYSFAAAGVYMIKLVVTDDDGGEGTATQIQGVDAMIVVYDPSAGFVAGGGWFDSPAGAYAADPSLTGKASFGFVSKYKKGATVPTGETEFEFMAAGLAFQSTSYDWLVISGAKAQFKGSGTINGAGDYAFLLTATDGGLVSGDTPDKLRMKITDKATSAVVYDNQLAEPDGADPTTALGGGSIVIHGSLAGRMLPQSTQTALLVNGLAEVRPNPFRGAAEIRYSLRERSLVSLELYNLAGRRLRTLVGAMEDAGVHAVSVSRTDAEGGPLSAGVYFVRMSTRPLAGGPNFAATRKLIVVE